MANKGEAIPEADYESDPDDAPLPSMRRREASDDEDGGRSHGGGRPLSKDLRAGMRYDGDFEGQGGAQRYDEEEEEEEDEEYYDEEEDELGDVEEEAAAEKQGILGEEGLVVRKEVGHREGKEIAEGEGRQDGPGSVSEGSAPDHRQEKDTASGDEKKENEPYAVPTTGAFYMHDDRFQENGRGSNRRMLGWRKLWDPKAERAWVHDRFKDMDLQDSHFGEERHKGQFRGRGGGRHRGGDRGGYVRGDKPHKYHDDSNDQNRVPRTVRGRGPRRYESLAKSNREIPGSGRKEYPEKPQEIMSGSTTGRRASLAANNSPHLALPWKHTFASSLNSASPPFYPSGSSNQDSLTQKRDSRSGYSSKSHSNAVQTEDNLLAPQSISLLRGKAARNPVFQDKMYMDDNLRSVSGKNVGSYPQSSGYPFSSANALHNSSSRIEGRGLSIAGPPASNQTPSSLSQVGRFSSQAQMQIFEQRPTQIPIQPGLFTQKLVQSPGSENQASPSQLTAEVGENGSPPGSSKSKTPLVAKGKTNNQGMGRGSFLYGGAQVIGATGAVGLAHGDQNFPGTPALLPVMHFGNQHPGGLGGVPSVGMALPGYVAQPQLGFGNSEMAWMPVLAGAAGALGASYCSPYITLDENYYPRSTGHSSLSVSPRETSTNKPATSMKTSSKPEATNEELVQRHNKPRRYSEMSFGHRST